MGLVVSIGGLIFGYESGDIAGFLAMSNFRERFGTLDPTTGSYVFRNVRSGLLVGMVCVLLVLLCGTKPPLITFSFRLGISAVL
jgi:hypothetical protein